MPLTGDIDLFRRLASLGQQLVAYHLLQAGEPPTPEVAYAGQRHPVVATVSHVDGAVWLDKSGANRFEGVTPDVWGFFIGGYQVCERWLKDRKGRTLSDDDVEHYGRIVNAISATIDVMAELDEVIHRAGGWPGAFAYGSPRV